MKAAGFTGKFKATNGDQVITGEIKESGDIETRKVATSAESRQAIKNIFKANK